MRRFVGSEVHHTLASECCGRGKCEYKAPRDWSVCQNLVLRWQHEKAHVHARHISENMELLAQFDEAERAGDVDKLAFCVRSLIVQAASSRAVGMSAKARCVFKRERSRKGPLDPRWFDWECWEKRLRKFI